MSSFSDWLFATKMGGASRKNQFAALETPPMNGDAPQDAGAGGGGGHGVGEELQCTRR